MRPDNYRDYQQWWVQHGPDRIDAYAEGKTSYVEYLSPQHALTFNGVDLLQLLYRRLGGANLQSATNPLAKVPSPVAGEMDGEWLKSCATVGVNVRTIGSFFNLLKYALTLPAHVRGVHLLPIWEPGVVGSLYGMVSWRINPEFFDLEMARIIPGARTAEDQLRIVVNLLHATGKVVGMDVIPHVDRYAEMVMDHPDYFEWLRRDGLELTDHRADLHEEAREVIAAQRSSGRSGVNRLTLIDALYHAGLEPAPATMAPPYRGLEVDPRPEAKTVDAAGRVWRDYRITEPTTMSRAFGPLTRYKFWDRKDNNANWEIDFSRPRTAVWDYFTEHYAAVQLRFNFDFMRGDMSHVQMRPGGVPAERDAFYDPLRAVKKRIQQRAPYFGYFAESFLAEPGFMAYGDEVAHLVASEAEVTLGNLQSTVPGGEAFTEELRRYLSIAAETSVTPSFTVITGDKDDPRFDHFHHHGEVARMFTGLFCEKLPLYYALGYEQRNRHHQPAPNEFYTKLYVFQEDDGPKATNGDWRWGGNFGLFWALGDLQRFAAGIERHLGAVAGTMEVASTGLTHWIRPDTYGDAAYLFLANFGAEPLEFVTVPNPTAYRQADLVYAYPTAVHHQLGAETGEISIGELSGGSVRCYQLR